MKYWCVNTKFFDSGHVKVRVYPVEAESKPVNGLRENAMRDEYHDYFEAYEDAAMWVKQAREA